MPAHFVLCPGSWDKVFAGYSWIYYSCQREGKPRKGPLLPDWVIHLHFLQGSRCEPASFRAGMKSLSAKVKLPLGLDKDSQRLIDSMMPSDGASTQLHSGLSSG